MLQNVTVDSVAVSLFQITVRRASFSLFLGFSLASFFSPVVSDPVLKNHQNPLDDTFEPGLQHVLPVRGAHKNPTLACDTFEPGFPRPWCWILRS